MQEFTWEQLAAVFDPIHINRALDSAANYLVTFITVRSARLPEGTLAIRSNTKSSPFAFVGFPLITLCGSSQRILTDVVYSATLYVFWSTYSKCLLQQRADYYILNNRYAITKPFITWNVLYTMLIDNYNCYLQTNGLLLWQLSFLQISNTTLKFWSEFNQ